ncbi:DNA recombination protein RmuC, partial [Streptococcus anginosus]|nr:DNA recombination protein RmuC [Streptococcus anginosus]
ERQRAGQHASLAEQLRARAQAERELLVTTSSLASALRSRSSRGLWGEVELARVLEISGMMPHVDFSEQRSVGSVLASRSSATASSGTTASRPDVVIHLPGGGYL